LIALSTALLQTTNLVLQPKTRDEVEAMLERMTPYERAQVSPDWLARIRASSNVDPWLHGFSAVHRDSGVFVGTGGFKGPPMDGVVEIAYAVEAAQQGKGYATEIAAALTRFAFASAAVKLVIAHTLPQGDASKKVLTKCGFQYVGDIVDPEDGLVARFEKRSV
jgi:[ribosomal protein S5]-alanine N-acetyltransferase